MPIITTRDELGLAWRRVRRDMKERHFTVHPDIVDWIEFDLNGWLDAVGAELATGYTPRPSKFAAVPKAGGLIRPGTILELEDAVVYNLLVGRLLPAIIDQLRWSQRKVDTAYPLPNESKVVAWTEIGFLVWQNWRDRSAACLSATGVEYVVVSDITGFYENVDLQRLASDVRAIGADGEVVELLQNCLRNWALPRNEGIPQGYSASDILAKLYLDGVDRNLKNDGFTHVRYVDDIRVFCRTRLEARRVIHRLTAHLYPRGLNLQSAKTQILDKRQARRKFSGVDEIITNLNQKLAAEMSVAAGGYIKPAEVLQALAQHAGPAPEVLERAFHEHFSFGSDLPFDSTLFHYLLVRLAKVGSRIAVTYCLDVLATRPEETGQILAYFTSVRLSVDDEAVVTEYLASDEAIYDYQGYQILRWFYDEHVGNEELLQLCRRWVADRNRDQWLRSYALAYVRAFGSAADWAQIEESYGDAMTELERADRVAALERLERGRRNTFYARVGGHGKLVSRAVAVAKARTPAG